VSRSFEELDRLLIELVEERNAALDTSTQDTYPHPKDGWRCFHCGHVFYHAPQAAKHFGIQPSQTPACVIKVDELGLVGRIRELEAALQQK
jgi:hypothetical protein